MNQQYKSCKLKSKANKLQFILRDRIPTDKYHKNKIFGFTSTIQCGSDSQDRSQVAWEADFATFKKLAKAALEKKFIQVLDQILLTTSFSTQVRIRLPLGFAFRDAQRTVQAINLAEPRNTPRRRETLR